MKTRAPRQQTRPFCAVLGNFIIIGRPGTGKTDWPSLFLQRCRAGAARPRTHGGA